jgi:uridine kinase
MIHQMALDGLLDRPARLGGVRLVAIDGPSGSGKSVLADAVAAELRAAGTRTGLVRTDHFATWDDPVAWWPRLAAGVLDPLRNGRPGTYLCVEWRDGKPHPGPYLAVEVPEVLVLEGVSAGRRSVRADLSLLIWCEHRDPAERLERAVARDGEACRAPLRAWQRFEEGWFAVDQTGDAADVRLADELH